MSWVFLGVTTQSACLVNFKVSNPLHFCQANLSAFFTLVCMQTRVKKTVCRVCRVKTVRINSKEHIGDAFNVHQYIKRTTCTNLVQIFKLVVLLPLSILDFMCFMRLPTNGMKCLKVDNFHLNQFK